MTLQLKTIIDSAIEEAMQIASQVTLNMGEQEKLASSTQGIAVTHIDPMHRFFHPKPQLSAQFEWIF